MTKRHRIATTLFLMSVGCTAIPALTDTDGYPLVGNVMSKGDPKPRPRPRPDGTGPKPHRAESEPGPAGPEGIA